MDPVDAVFIGLSVLDVFSTNKDAENSANADNAYQQAQTKIEQDNDNAMSASQAYSTQDRMASNYRYQATEDVQSEYQWPGQHKSPVFYNGKGLADNSVGEDKDNTISSYTEQPKSIFGINLGNTKTHRFNETSKDVRIYER